MEHGRTILVTGCAGFIGSFTAQRLLANGNRVVGVDILNSYYDPTLKQARLDRLLATPGFTFHRIDCADRAQVAALFAGNRFDRVIHLAAQAGVRHSLSQPFDYIESNLTGFLTMLEGCRHHQVPHLVYASSSSVYGINKTMPFSTHHGTSHPTSLYGATKRANELMAHSYSHLFGVPTTGLRFFTAYGPWGRPDMVMFLFAERILAGRPIDVFNRGEMLRDFTFIEDIVEGITRVMDHIPGGDPTWNGFAPDPASSPAPYRIYNIGNRNPVQLMYLISTMERLLGRKAELNLLPMQPGDIPASDADASDLERDVGFRPKTPIEDGVAAFIDWYRSYYGK